MSNYYSTKNIYDKRGTLLLKKDEKITDDIQKKLVRLGQYEPDKIENASEKHNSVIAPNDIKSADLTPIIKDFAVRKNIRNSRILEKSNEVLINIIFETKTKPWWIYIIE